MPRATRVAPGGFVYHAEPRRGTLKRAGARLPLLEEAGDLDAFERVLVEAQARCPIRILDNCRMPHYWYFALWPVERFHRPQAEAELEAVRRSVVRGQPFGTERWREPTAAELGLESMLRRPGRPRKPSRPQAG